MPSWKKVLISGSDAALNSLNVTTTLVASGITYPSSDGSSGQVLITDGAGQLSFSSLSSGGSGSSIKLSQTVAATTWSFAHNLNEKFPVVTIYDGSDEVIIPQKIDAVDNNNMLIYFSSARTGTAAAVVGGYTVSSSYSTFAENSATSSYALTASYLEGYISPFPFTGSAIITGSLEITGSTSSTGGFTGSLFGTASNAISASYALTSSYSINPIVSGSIGPVDSIYFNTSSAVSVNVAEIAWNPLDGTFDMGLLNNVTLQVGQEMHFYGKATGAISNGDAVMFAGSQGDHILISKASQATINEHPEYFIGVATQAFTNNEFGYVTVLGKVRGLNTLAYNQGAVLYFDSEGTTAGALTSTKPVAPNAKIEVAAVVRVHGTQGILEVRPHVMPKLEDIQDVGITNASFGDLLVRNNDTWRNTKQLSGSYGLTGSLNATSFTGSLSGTATNAHSGSDFVVTNTLKIDGSLTDYNTVSSTTIGSNALYTQATGSYTAAFCKYTLLKGTNARAGEFMTVWNGNTTTYTDTSTTDIGSTSDISFISNIVTGNIEIVATAASTGWTIKTLVTYI
jgi:hypothetical protein